VDRRRVGIVVGLGGIAVVAAVALTSGVDTGAPVGERARVRPAVAPVEVADPAEPVVRAAPSRPFVPPTGVSEPVAGAADADGPPTLGRPPGAMVGRPDASPEAAALTTGRRFTMMENLFRAARRAASDPAAQESVGRVLDDALARMEGLEARVAAGEIAYRDAVVEMNAARDAAAAEIDGLLPPDEAELVKLRMGVRASSAAAVPQVDWSASKDPEE